MAYRRELGRGERVLPGLWRLRLPLPWPTAPHGNAWAIAASSGVVLVDAGYYESGSMAELERAMGEVDLRIEDVQLLAVTHAHTDHWGQAAPIVERAGCELWMHPNHEHATNSEHDPAAAMAHRLEVERGSGAPGTVLARKTEGEGQRTHAGIAELILPDKHLVGGVRIDTELGRWYVYETPGHAPSHVCLYQPEHRLLITGDHVLGHTHLYYDYGWTPDPVGEFLNSLDVVDELDARLGLSGHGRPFVDVRAHIERCRSLVYDRRDAALTALGAEPRTALDIAPAVLGEPLNEAEAAERLWETLCYLTHLEQLGLVESEPDGEVIRWRALFAEPLDRHP